MIRQEHKFGMSASVTCATTTADAATTAVTTTTADAATTAVTTTIPQTGGLDWYDSDGEPSTIPWITKEPEYHGVYGPFVVEIINKIGWYCKILKKIKGLFQELDVRNLEKPGIKLSILHKIDKAMKEATIDYGLLRDAYNKYWEVIPLCEDPMLFDLEQEIELFEKRCYIQVFINNGGSMLEKDNTSRIDILKETWDDFIEEMRLHYDGDDIYVFVPETSLSSYFYDHEMYKIVDGLVSQDQADATWEWLLENGFDYSGYITFNNELPMSFETQNNVCLYFKYKLRKTTRDPE